MLIRRTSKQRVLHIVPALFGEQGIVGGAERYALELARYMAQQVPTKLVSYGAKNEEYTTDNLRIRVIGSPVYVRGQSSNPFAASLIAEILKADIVHCHQQHLLGSSIAAITCRLTRRKVFVSDLGGGGWDISSYMTTDRWYHGHLHISEYSRKVFGHSGKPWAKVIYGGVDTTKFSPDPSVTKLPKVLYVGRIMPHKGIDDLVRAIPDDLPLEIIGKPYDARFISDLHDLAQGKTVLFRHDCSDKEIVTAYRSALCVVLPSVYRNRYFGETKVPELLGQTLLEGMSCGTPAICTDVASMPEVVEDGVTGFVVPPNSPELLREKLIWLKEHPKRAAEMGAAGRTRVLNHFNWPEVVRRCLAAYGV